MKTWKKSGRLSCYGGHGSGGLSVAAGQQEGSKIDRREKKKVHLTVFAAASMTETLNQLKQEYENSIPM